MRWLPLLLLGCEVPLEDTGGDGLSEVSWVLDWDDSGVVWSEAGWCEDDVCVHEGRLVTAMTSMVACTDTTARVAPSWTDWIVPVAVAGHPGDTDPSAWMEGRTEDLVDPIRDRVARIELFGDTYCKTHWAVDAAWGDSGTSLVLRGTFREEGRPIPFTIETDLAWGELRESVALPELSGPAEVRVIRSLGSMFDGVDLLAEDADRAILRNLAENTRFEVRSVDP